VTVVVIPVIPQETEVKDPQLPENSCSLAPEVFNSLPIADRETVKLLPAGANLYHTSSSGLPVAQPAETPELALANHTVPEVLATPLERLMAPEHSSLTGGAVAVAVILNAEPAAAPPIEPVPAE